MCLRTVSIGGHSHGQQRNGTDLRVQYKVITPLSPIFTQTLVMHAIFAIKDILDEVFCWLSQHECTVVARVNKTWFRSAIPTIWPDVSLIEGLIPLGAQIDLEGEYCFPIAPNWDRFFIYAPYVRVLHVYPEDVALLRMIMRVRPSAVQYLFPNCQALNWAVASNYGLANPSILIPPSIRHLRLSVHALPLPFLDLLGRTLVTRMPVLLSLGIDVIDESPHPECQHVVNRLLSFFSQSLRWVKIPNMFVTEATAQTLSQFPSLFQLMITRSAEQEVAEPVMATSACANDPDGFDRLTSLSFFGTQKTLYNTLLDRFKFSALTMFHWKFDLESIHFDRLVDALVSKCPQLTFLEIGKPPQSQSETSQRVFLQSVAWSSVRALLACKNLTSLILNCVQVPNNTKELTDLLADRKTWEEIALYTTKPLKLDDIILFATHCPKLGKLSIFLDISVDAGPVPKLEPGISFPVLHQIDFVYSLTTPGHTTDVAQFLYNICETTPYLWGWDARFWVSVALAITTCYIQEGLTTGKPLAPNIQLYIDDQVSLKRQMEESAFETGVIFPSRDYRAIYTPLEDDWSDWDGLGSESDSEEEEELFLDDEKAEPICVDWA